MNLVEFLQSEPHFVAEDVGYDELLSSVKKRYGVNLPENVKFIVIDDKELENKVDNFNELFSTLWDCGMSYCGHFIKEAMKGLGYNVVEIYDEVFNSVVAFESADDEFALSYEEEWAAAETAEKNEALALEEAGLVSSEEW